MAKKKVARSDSQKKYGSRKRRKKSSHSSERTLLSRVSAKLPLHLVAVPLGEPPRVVTCESFQQFQEAIDELLGTDTRLFVFQGHRHQLSAGPYHYLLAADGERMPLFEMPKPEDAVASEDGFVGESYEEEDEEEEVEEVAEQPLVTADAYPRVSEEDEWYEDEEEGADA